MTDTRLEIDRKRGVVYVYDATTGETLLRVCRLPLPMPENVGLIDVTNGIGSSYSPKAVIETGSAEPVSKGSEECTGANDGTCPRHPGINVTQI